MSSFATRLLAVLVIGSPILVLAQSTPPGQASQQPTFKSGTRTVAVYTTVTDGAGRLVPDLTQEDFEIYDNGKLRPITVFSNEIQPITLVMMLDRSGSMKTNFELVRAGAEALVRRLLPEDKTRIGSFSNKIQIDPEEFTSNQNEMIGILRSELLPEGPTPLWNAVDKAMTALRGEQGRRVVLVFTDGVDAPMNFSMRNVSLPDVMERSQKEDVMVYAIGLESVVPWGNRRAPLGGTTGGIGGWQSSGMISQQPDAGLPKIASESGGGYFELKGTDNLRATFARVADELHHQYALAFEPEKLDGKRHKLEVKLKQKGMKARARTSYVATADR
jgi:VWFA-related protein